MFQALAFVTGLLHSTRLKIEAAHEAVLNVMNDESKKVRDSFTPEELARLKAFEESIKGIQLTPEEEEGNP